LTQEQLAVRSGVAVGIIRKLERRANLPTWKTAVILAAALTVKTEAFLRAPAGQAPAKPGRPPKAGPAVEALAPEKPRGGRAKGK
jgi:transcriptional regulator with XRE-family HTH domain